MQLNESGEGGVEFALGAGLQNMELHPLRTRRFLPVSDYALGKSAVRIHEIAITLAWGTNSDNSSSRLGISSAAKTVKPVRLPPGRARLATSLSRTGSPP